MKLYEVAVKRPVTAIMLILSLVFFGAVSYTKTSVDMFPSVNMPIALIMTSYDAGPSEVESIVTTNIETAISRIPKVKTISSSSSEGTSLVIVQFQDDVDMDSVMFKLDQYISMVKPMLPEKVSDPIILALDPTQLPVMEAVISHDSMDQAQLYKYVNTNVLPSLESINGVSSVSMVGGVDSQVLITLSQEKLLNYGFAIDSLIQQLSLENISLPGGITSKGDLELSLKVDGKFKSIDDIKNLTLVSQATGSKVKLGDIANVELTNKDLDTIYRSNGNPSIGLTFNKESTANIIKTADEIENRLEELQEEHNGIQTQIVSDQSTFIEDSVNSVIESALLGVVLAVIVLLIFLKDIKTALIVGLAMPISIISTFTFLYMLNITMNLLSLGGLTFAVGMLVDNSIIVLENIFRYIQMGENKVDAAIKGTKEIFMPVLASTFTNIAIFLPIVFTGGMIGDWLSNLALTITVSLLCSLIVSVTVIPMFASLFIKNTDKIHLMAKPSKNTKVSAFLGYGLKHRKTMIFTTVIASLLALVLASTCGLELMPSMYADSYNINITIDNGTKLEVSSKYIENLEENLAKTPYVESYITSIGSGNFGMSNSSSISVIVNTSKNSGKSYEQMSEDLLSITKNSIPAKEVSVTNAGTTAMMGGMLDSGVSFSLKGTNLEQLKVTSDEILDIVLKQPYIKDASHSYEDGLPYIDVSIDKEKAATYGLTSAQIATTIDTYQNGKVASRYSIDGTEIDIVVKTDTDSKESIEKLKEIKIPTATGTLIPLSSIATLTQKVSPATISKTDKIMEVTFNLDLKDISQGQARTKLQEALKSVEVPKGYSLEFTGSTKELMDSVNQMLFAIAAGVVLIYMILAAQFESFKHPLIIMISIPFSFTGGFILLSILRTPISVPILMGMLMLVGIVVNNAILIVDTINSFRRQDQMDIIPAIKLAVIIRMRPILLTTLTTILGLIPMAIGIGQGTKLLQPMAIFVSGGLALGTVLTLVIVPVIYLLTDKERKSDKAKQDIENFTQI